LYSCALKAKHGCEAIPVSDKGQTIVSDNNKTPEPPPSKAYRTTEKILGIASVVAIGLSLFGATSIFGAALQGAITAVQVGMDLAAGRKKKAAIDFAIGGALTVASIIPFLGAVGNFAKFGILGADGLKIGGAAEKAGVLGAEELAGGALKSESLVAKIGNAIKKPFKAVGGWIKKGFSAVGDFLEEHFPTAVNFIKEHIVAPIKGFFEKLSGKAWGAHNDLVERVAGPVGNPTRLGKFGMKVVEHSQVSNGVRMAADVGGVGLSFVNDSPPATAIIDPYDPSQSSDAPQADVSASSPQWRRRIQAQREAQAQAAANGATPS
jgi:hypothetical protein